MRTVPPYGCIAAVILMAALVYFGYQVASVYIQQQEYEKLYKEIHQNNNSPLAGDVDELMAKVDHALAKHNSTEFKALKTELLLYQAYYYPEDSLQPLRQALPLGLEVYRAGEVYQDTAGWYVAWSLDYAGLPARLERWINEVMIRAPHMRPQLTRMLINSRLLQDDVDGVQGIIESELKERGHLTSGRMTALTGYMLLGEYEQAEELIPSADELHGLDANQIMTLAEISLETEHFAQAHEYLDQIRELMSDDPEYALMDATAIAGLRGLDDPQIPALLKTAAATTRIPCSEAGCKAWVYSSLAAITEENVWHEELVKLVEENPEDCNVAASMAHVLVRRNGNAIDNNEKITQSDADKTVAAAELVTELADSKLQQSSTLLRLAYAQSQSALLKTQADDPEAEQMRNITLGTLRRAIGDPDVVDTVRCDCFIDYTAFLLEPSVIELRKINADFDKQVNEAVIDYLNRRIDLFNSIPQLQPLQKLLYRSENSDVVDDSGVTIQSEESADDEVIDEQQTSQEEPQEV